MYPVTLTGRAVTLREFRSDDAADSLAVVGDDRVTHWLSFDSRDLAAAQAMIDGAVQRARHEPRTEYYLAITAEDDELVGFTRLAFAGVKAAKLGYAIRAVAERLGMQYEGIIRDHVFTNGGWRDSRLYAVLEHGWPASRV
jgi:ribosomal-protein-alanine N-acetyltransferase